jgi:SAM-dependent methyltransferase
MTPLCELAAKYGTDKYPWYTPFYHALLYPRCKQVFNVLEIGIGTPRAMQHMPGYQSGSSLRMWRDYFPNALVTGIDHDESALFREPRIETFLGGQAVPSTISQHLWGMKFDLVVDDGSRDPQHQARTFRELESLLAPGGLYVIEDVNNFDFLAYYLNHPHARVECHYADRVGRLVLI